MANTARRYYAVPCHGFSLIPIDVEHPVPAQHSEMTDQHDIRTTDYRTLERGLAGSIGRVLRRSRIDRGWSQQQAAERLSVSRAQYLRYESGASVPRLHTAALWSLQFGAPPTVLLANSVYEHQAALLPPNFFRLTPWLRNAPESLFAQLLQQLSQLTGHRLELPATGILSLSQQVLTQAEQEVRSLAIYATVGKNLKSLRRSLGHSQEALATGLGVSTSHYLGVEKGSVSYSFALLPRFVYSLQRSTLELTHNTNYYRARSVLHERFMLMSQLLSELNSDQQESVFTIVEQAMKLYSDCHNEN